MGEGARSREDSLSFYGRRWQYHPPWHVTDWWRPRVFLSSDEYLNPSWSLVLPPLGWIVIFYGRHFDRSPTAYARAEAVVYAEAEGESHMGMRGRAAEIEQALDAMDAAYGGDLAEHLGADWREVLRPHVEGAWNFGYTTAMGDSARIDRKILEAESPAHVDALRLTVLDALGWVHAFNSGDAEPGEASLYLDSMPNDLLPDEHFDPERLRAVRALSLEPLLALGVRQTEALDRAWDLFMEQHPRVAGGVLLRLEPAAVSILFRLALDANHAAEE